MPKRGIKGGVTATRSAHAGTAKRHCCGEETIGEAAGSAHPRAESPAHDCFDSPWLPGTDLQYLKNLQKLNAKYNPQHKYVSYRKLLVSFIIDVCEDLKLQHVTVHRALNYLDRLLTKFEEQPNNVPTLSVFTKANIAGLEKKQQLIEAERVLLENLEWNALSATHLHFSHCYINKGVLCKADTIDTKPVTKQDLRVIHKYIEFLAKLCLQDYSLLQHEQALVSAAAVAVARGACRIDTIWPDELAAMVGYSMQDIKPCYDRIKSLFKSRDASPSEKPPSQARPSPQCVIDGVSSFLGSAGTPGTPDPPTFTKSVGSSAKVVTPKHVDKSKLEFGDSDARSVALLQNRYGNTPW